MEDRALIHALRKRFAPKSKFRCVDPVLSESRTRTTALSSYVIHPVFETP
jgi:hypothetical protein